MKNILLYPGTFDPIHNGHLSIADRASKLFDKMIFTVADNADKNPLFTVKEREIMIAKATKHLNNVEVKSTSDLIVNFAKQENAIALIRGLRHVSDFEFEFQMAMMNCHLDPNIFTIFMMPDEHFIHINSTVIKNVAKLNGDISKYVPKTVEDCLNRKFHK